jgi:hypothetical protein
MAFANQPQHLRRFVQNEFGMVRDGQVVYPEFNEQIHMSGAALEYLPAVPLVFGLDGGTTPALVIGQRVGRQLRILDELVIYDPKKDNELQQMGAKAFAELARDMLAISYPKAVFGMGYYDPACDWGDDDDMQSWLDRFKAVFGGTWRPGGAEGNRLEPRLSAVRDLLTSNPGGNPGLLISGRCKMLRRGFGGGYVIERVKTTAGGRFRDKPTKNDFSHAQDALQYLCLGMNGRTDIIDDIDRRRVGRDAAPRVAYGKGYFSEKQAGRVR